MPKIHVAASAAILFSWAACGSQPAAEVTPCGDAGAACASGSGSSAGSSGGVSSATSGPIGGSSSGNSSSLGGSSASSIGSSSGGGTSATGTGGSSSGSSSAGTDADAGAAQGLSNLPAETWTWVPIPGAICRDGSATGIGVNANPASNGLVIFLEGGGACYDLVTCLGNPSTYGALEFGAAFGPGGFEASAGIFDRSDPSNPAADWTFVYIPYCTGDVHAGGNDAGTVTGVGPQQFVGYLNVGLDLAAIVPGFPKATEVLLTGISAGGFGAAVNYDQVAAAFGSVPVELLDDSGPPMSGQYVAACQQTLVDTTWNLGATILADCGADCPDATDFLLPYFKHVVRTHPNRAMGLLDADQDAVISDFYGYGYYNCQADGAPMPGATYQAGLLDTRTELAAYPNFGLYTWNSTQHTVLEGDGLATLDNLDAGVALSAWAAGIIDGGVSNVGP